MSWYIILLKSYPCKLVFKDKFYKLSLYHARHRSISNSWSSSICSKGFVYCNYSKANAWFFVLVLSLSLVELFDYLLYCTYKYFVDHYLNKTLGLHLSRVILEPIKLCFKLFFEKEYWGTKIIIQNFKVRIIMYTCTIKKCNSMTLWLL